MKFIIYQVAFLEEVVLNRSVKEAVTFPRAQVESFLSAKSQ